MRSPENGLNKSLHLRIQELEKSIRNFIVILETKEALDQFVQFAQAK
jgi:hypothetical protein